MIAALENGTAPWQKPWEPGERVLPHNFSSGRSYRGGNAMYLALDGNREGGGADPRWGGFKGGRCGTPRRRGPAESGRGKAWELER